MIDTSKHTPNDAAIVAIIAALDRCYGSRHQPNFAQVSNKLRSNPYGPLIDMLRANGAEIVDLTDLSNDVSIQLVLNSSDDQVGLGLSGVGLYATLLHQNMDGRYAWVTQPNNAPTQLARSVAQAVQRAGFELLSRSLLSQTVEMAWYDGSEEIMLYQALFSDVDVIA